MTYTANLSKSSALPQSTNGDFGEAPRHSASDFWAGGIAREFAAFRAACAHADPGMLNVWQAGASFAKTLSAFRNNIATAQRDELIKWQQADDALADIAARIHNAKSGELVPIYAHDLIVQRDNLRTVLESSDRLINGLLLPILRYYDTFTTRFVATCNAAYGNPLFTRALRVNHIGGNRLALCAVLVPELLSDLEMAHALARAESISAKNRVHLENAYMLGKFTASRLSRVDSN